MSERTVALHAGGVDGARVWRDQYVVFEATKTRKSTPNKAKIDIYNLSIESIRYLESASVVRLLVDDLPLYQGDITPAMIVSKQAGPDRITTLNCGDGRAVFASGSVSVSYPPGTPRVAALRAIVGVAGLTTRGAITDTGEVFDAGWAFVGKIPRALDELSPGWSVQGGVLDFGEDSARKVLRLAEGTGLIGSPERTDKGVNIKCVLTPWLSPHDIVSLDSRFVKGYYRVREVTHRGDSRGGSWETELVCGAEL